MSDIVNEIGYAMSLRAPQKEALSYLDAISSHCDYQKNSKAEIETIRRNFLRTDLKSATVSLSGRFLLIVIRSENM